jgi:signal transduction histidine kinase
MISIPLSDFRSATAMIRVLYVDDEPDLLDLVKIFLERSGEIGVDTALSAQAALVMMKNHYDAIVYDFQMPGRDGIAFLKQIRSGKENIAIILFTGKGREEAVIEAINNGADFYVWKDGDTTLRFAELQHRIRQAVQGRLAETELTRKNKKITLLYNISRHDIANHLTVLRAKIKQVKKLSKDPTLLPHINKIEEEAREIYNDLENARICQEIGINVQEWHIVADILRPVISGAGTAGIRCFVDVGNLEIYADPLLPRVFSNLLDNVLRHGSHVTSITVTCHRTAGGMLVIWEDDGVGIPAEEKERVFDEGYGKNTGLGLFLCREILAITGITLQENGVPGKGARFELLIPKGKYRCGGEAQMVSEDTMRRSELQSEK